MTENIVERIKNAPANTMIRVNNVIWAKMSNAENSVWRSAFGEMYANAFINRVRQSKNVEFLDKTPLKSVREPRERRKSVAEKYHVREEESDFRTD